MHLIKIYSQTSLGGIEKLLSDKGFSRHPRPNMNFVWQYAHPEAKGNYMGAYEFAGREYFQMHPEAIARANERYGETVDQPRTVPAKNFEWDDVTMYHTITGSLPTSIITFPDESAVRFLKAVTPFEQNPIVVVARELNDANFTANGRMYGLDTYLQALQKLGERKG